MEMTMPILFRGVIAGVRKGEFQNKKYLVLQFSEDTAEDAIAHTEVNMPDGTDPAAFKKGQSVELPLRISAKDKKIYYRALDTGTPAPTAPRAAAKA
jgi:hypothetical protein